MNYDINFIDNTPIDIWNSNIATALIALLGVVISVLATSWMNKKLTESQQKLEEKMIQRQIDADIRAKARINWIQSARNISTEIIDGTFCLIQDTNRYLSLTKRINEQRNKGESAPSGMIDKRGEAFYHIQRGVTRLNKNVTLFKLFFGPNAENDVIVDFSIDVFKKAASISKEIETYRYYVGENETKEEMSIRVNDMNNQVKSDLIALKKTIDEFTDSSRNYYKKEWDRAKNGE